MHWRFLVSKPVQRFSKWRLIFLVFTIVYAGFLVFNLGSMTMQWDEANHLDGALLLLHGRTQKYVESSLFYPPLDDLLIAGYFAIAGPSIFVGRLLAITFAILSIWALFEFVHRTYGPKTAVISGILLATMPGFIWLSRLAMLETMLIFFFSTSMMLFFMWLQKFDDKFLAFSAIALGLGFLTKYQTIVAIPAMIVGIFVLNRSHLKSRFWKFSFLLLTLILISLPWVIISYKAYSSGLLSQWLYAMGTGNPQKYAYSLRFPEPIFYLVELAWPYGAVHPISIFIYVLGLLGLVVLAVRRTSVDKFLLIWFFALYVFFTLLGNRQWRYMVPVFPVLAISAATLATSAFGRVEKAWKRPDLNLRKIQVKKVMAAFMVAVVVFSVAYSCVDAYNWTTKDALFSMPVGQATSYAVSRLDGNGSLMVLCAINVFSADIVKFYVYASPRRQRFVGQYPELPVDTYPPSFSVSELINLCEMHDVEFLLLYEYGESYPYYNSDLTMSQVYSMLADSPRFDICTCFGSYPNKVYVLSFQ